MKNTSVESSVDAKSFSIPDVHDRGGSVDDVSIKFKDKDSHEGVQMSMEMSRDSWCAYRGLKVNDRMKYPSGRIVGASADQETTSMRASRDSIG